MRSISSFNNINVDIQRQLDDLKIKINIPFVFAFVAGYMMVFETDYANTATKH